MKDALAQEQEPVVYQCPRCATSMQVDLTAKAALAQPTQEPVAWVDPTTLHHLKIGLEGVHLVYETEMVNSLPLYDKPQFQNPKQCLERLIRIMGTFDLATGHADTWDELLDSLESELRDVLGHYREALAQQADHSEQHLDMVKAQSAQQEPWCMKMNGCKTKCEDCPVEVVEQEPISFGIRGGMAHDIGIKND